MDTEKLQRIEQACDRASTYWLGHGRSIDPNGRARAELEGLLRAAVHEIDPNVRLDLGEFSVRPDPETGKSTAYFTLNLQDTPAPEYTKEED